MKVILHDLDRRYDEVIASKCDRVIAAFEGLKGELAE